MPEKRRKEKSKTMADRFLEDARDSRWPISMYLLSGFQLKGDVVEFDEATILFKNRGVHQLVMRPAVANVYPLSDSKGDTDKWWRSYVSSAPGEEPEDTQ